MTASDSSQYASQRARLRALQYIALFYGVDVVLLGLFALAGVIPLAVAVAYALVGTLTTGGVYVIVLLGWNLRFSGSNFTLAHTFVATLAKFPFLAWAPELTLLFLFSLFMIATMASLEASGRQLTWWWVFALVGVAAALLPNLGRLEIPSDTVWEAALSWLTVAFALGRFLISTSRMNLPREHLQRRQSELRDSYQRVEQLAVRDELTGVYNRRGLIGCLEEERERSNQTGGTFSIVVFDLDHFKSVNDTYGHVVGDHLLSEFAARLHERLRTVDVLGRYGGEEFVVMLMGARLAGATRIAERLREYIAQSKWDDLVPGLALTISGGVAEYRPGEPLEALLDRADQALYEAKRGGRNRIISASRDRHLVTAW